MDKKNCGDYEVTCSSCGRPWAVCKEKGGCSKCGDVRFCEYGRKASGCIREKQPGCPMQAVIPSVTVDTVNGIKGLSDCLVHVADINTTYYIDDQHRLLTTWGGPVSVYDYDFDENPLNLRNQMAYDTMNNVLAIFDKQGVAYKVPISDLNNDYTILENKPQINGHELDGNKSGEDLGLQNTILAGNGISISDDTISADRNPDNTYTKDEDDALRNANDYYDEITYKFERYYDTDCYFTTVPLRDSDNNLIELHVDANGGKTPTQYARANFTTLTTNATLTKKQSNDTYKDTIVIGDGQVLHEYDGEPIVNDYYRYVAIKADRTVVDYPVIGTTSAQMIADGVVQAFMVWFKIVTGGTAIEYELDVATARHPRQCIGVKANGDIIFLTCDGRTERSAGLTTLECAELLIDKGCVSAWNMDGGGSSSTTIEGSKLNMNIDGGGTADRSLNYSLNVVKPILENTAVDRAFSKIGEEKQNTLRQVINWSNGAFIHSMTEDIGGKDLNTLTNRIYVSYGNNLINHPSNEMGYFINIPHAEERFIGKYATQLYITRDSGRIFNRSFVNSEFTPWVLANGANKIFLYLQEAQTLDASGSYQNLKLTTNYQNAPGYLTPTNYVEGSTSRYYGFKINKLGYFQVQIQAQLKASANGNKYLRLGRNGGEISPTVTRRACTANSETIISTEAIVQNNNLNDVFSVQLYGSSGDSIERLKVIVEGCY